MAAFAGGVVALLLIALAAFPWGAFKDRLARHLSASSGRAVTIASMEREDAFSFVPTLRISGLRIAQPAWAGSGSMAQIDRATVRVPVVPLLFGHVHVHALAVDGLRLDLRRDADGRENWAGEKRGGGGEAPTIQTLTIRGGSLRLLDVRRKMTLNATVAADPAIGLAITGRGTHRGQPMTMTVRGGRIDAAGAHAPYPFRLHLRSPLLAIDGDGSMRSALDLGRFSAHLKTSGHDLQDLDDAIQAGLPATQEFALTGVIRHDRQDWSVEKLVGTIGRSAIDGKAMIRKREGRTIVDATIASTRFDFDDLSSDEGLARGAARRAKLGRRLIPDTPIDLTHLARTDGTIRFSTRQLLSKGGTPFRTLRATLTLDHGVLTVDPIVATLPHGAVTGRARIDGRSDSPHLALDLKLANGRITDLFLHQHNLDGALIGRIRLAGAGRTVRAALANGDGSVGLVSRGGSMDKRLAVLASGDVLKSAGEVIGGRDGDRVALRCIAVRFSGKGGHLAAAPFVLDTQIMRADGSGTMDLDGERLDLAIDGRPKTRATFSVKPAVQIKGTILDPALTIATTAGHHGLLAKAGQIIGHLRIGKDAAPPPAAPADCTALSARALD